MTHADARCLLARALVEARALPDNAFDGGRVSALTFAVALLDDLAMTTADARGLLAASLVEARANANGLAPDNAFDVGRGSALAFAVALLDDLAYLA